MINTLCDKSEGKKCTDQIGKHCNKLIGHATLAIDVIVVFSVTQFKIDQNKIKTVQYIIQKLDSR